MKKLISILLSCALIFSIVSTATFTSTAANEIHQVSFNGVVMPRPGEKPSDNYTKIGTGYTVSGPKWYEVTGESDLLLTDDSKFVAGKEYKISFVAWANSGYQFANVENLTATIDGFTADVNQYQGRYTTAVVEVSYTFVCDYKQITSVVLNAAALKTGDVLENTRFTTNSEGVAGAFCSFTRNGEDIANGEKVTYGDYGASILLIPEDTYAFADNVSITYGTNNFVVAGKIGKGIMVKSANNLWTIECEHTYDGWTADGTSCWQECTNCGEKININAHDFGPAVVEGDVKTYTCSICGYQKVDKYEDQGFRYADVEGGVMIVQYKGGENTIAIPSTLNGKPVVAIGDYAFANATNKTSIISITVPANVKSIGRGAFNGCSSLMTVNIPADVTRIETETFLGCSALANISIPYGVNYIGDRAFQGCAIISIVIPCSVTYIGSQAFRSCAKLEGVVVPDSVKTLGDAFMACSSLTDVVIGNGVTALAKSTLDGCTSLHSIVLPAGLTRIARYNLDNKSNFTDIYFRGSEEDWANVVVEPDNTNSAEIEYDYMEKYDVGQHKYVAAQTVEATCVDDGYTLNLCEGCGDAVASDIVPATGIHTFYAFKVITEATCQAEGSGIEICSVCDEEGETVTIPMTGHQYDSGVVKTAATFKKAGSMEYTCYFCGDKMTVSIAKLKSPKIKTVKAGKKSLTLTWAKVNNINGYKIQYSTNKKFKKAKTVTIKKNSTVKKVIKKLSKGKKYYTRIRGYVKISGKTVYSNWAKYKKAIKVK